MKKMFLAAALAVGMCVPVYANFDDNSDASIYATPVYDEDANSSSVVKKSAREENMGKALPIKMTGDQAEYDSVSGDFHLSGNVVITQGAEKLLNVTEKGYCGRRLDQREDLRFLPMHEVKGYQSDDRSRDPDLGHVWNALARCPYRRIRHLRRQSY